MQSIIDQIPVIVQILVSVVGTASLIAAAFGKPDNKYLGYAHSFVNFLAANFAQAKNASDVKSTDTAK